MASGGNRKNAGRKPGAKNKATLEKSAVQEAFNQRVLRASNALFNAQYSLAIGSVKVFRVDEEETDGKTKRIHVLVTNSEEIKDVLDNDGGAVGESFYFIQNVQPDNKAIDSLLNRTFGKPKDSLDVTSNGKDLLPKKYVVQVINGNTGSKHK